MNQLSREHPSVRMICPGGFILGPEHVEELIVLDHATEAEERAVLNHLNDAPGIEKADVVERTDDKVFIYFKAVETPETFCSQVVERNRCFKIGIEIQTDGVEQWKVGCVERADAENLLEELKDLGDLTHTSITEASWQNVITGDPS